MLESVDEFCGVFLGFKIKKNHLGGRNIVYPIKNFSFSCVFRTLDVSFSLDFCSGNLLSVAVFIEILLTPSQPENT